MVCAHICQKPAKSERVAATCCGTHMKGNHDHGIVYEVVFVLGEFHQTQIIMSRKSSCFDFQRLVKHEMRASYIGAMMCTGSS